MSRLEAWVNWVEQYCSPDGCETIRIDAGMLHEVLWNAMDEIQMLKDELDPTQPPDAEAILSQTTAATQKDS